MAEQESEQPLTLAMEFPRGKDQYALSAVIGVAEAGIMHRAKHVNPATRDEVAVSIKIVNAYEIEDIYSLAREVHEAESCDHENMVKVHCSFKNQDQLWIVMPPLPRLSIRSMIRSSFPRGLPENTVAFILKETLKALNYMHEKNRLHQNLGADCLFLDGTSRVKVAFRSLTYDQSSNDLNSSVFPDWMIAPELMIDYRKGQSKATDIWMFGLLALELFYGRIPASNFEEFQLLVLGIDDKFRMLKKNRGVVGSGLFGKIGVFSCFSTKDKKNISKPLGEVLAACLSREPKKRPTTNQLMEYKLFQRCFTEKEISLAKLKKACTNY
ncbi:serine/threonine-protein kinase BLUS1-like [Sesamum indicum]|uniref:Serine/threonine-protein kinase BLUS1-like n=1 Tax=Sesamum indicum TaxID=4182 RepID=A0A6I9UJV2_SESIN|nr:serine/threonine-protein kinase BLUS1-like [Sesamum indicum]